MVNYEVSKFLEDIKKCKAKESKYLARYIMIEYGTKGWHDWWTNSYDKLWRMTKSFYGVVKRLDFEKIKDFDVVMYEGNNLYYGTYGCLQLTKPNQKGGFATFTITMNHGRAESKWELTLAGKENEDVHQEFKNVYKLTDHINELLKKGEY